MRIESVFPLGQSGFINVDAQGIPFFDPTFFGMKLNFDSFDLRAFPLFDQNGAEGKGTER